MRRLSINGHLLRCHSSLAHLRRTVYASFRGISRALHMTISQQPPRGFQRCFGLEEAFAGSLAPEEHSQPVPRSPHLPYLLPAESPSSSSFEPSREPCAPALPEGSGRPASQRARGASGLPATAPRAGPTLRPGPPGRGPRSPGVHRPGPRQGRRARRTGRSS